MRGNILIILACILFAVSCKKEPETISNVEAEFKYSVYDCDCDNVDVSTLQLVNNEKEYIYTQELPSAITTQPNWRDKIYIVNLKVIETQCLCTIGVDPVPGGKDPPSEDVQKVEIMNIQEK